MRIPIRPLLFLLVTAAPAIASADDQATSGASPTKAALTVTSSAFEPNGAIPSDYTCDGDNHSPALSWSNVPDAAKTVAILVDDPDAKKGTFAHWIVVNIPSTETSLTANDSLPSGAAVAKNDKGTLGYSGPCPSSGMHHYHFTVFALDTTITTPTNRAAFMQEIQGHVLAKGELVGVYAKQGIKSYDSH
jgi:Raf kinase inhibitor-like YbhB/YbcL family protein